MPNGRMTPRRGRPPYNRWQREPRFFPYFFVFPRYRYNCPKDRCPYDRRYDDRRGRRYDDRYDRPNGWYGEPDRWSMVPPSDMDDY